jgi:poly(3-hydroxyalkanoate) depolymerase
VKKPKVTASGQPDIRYVDVEEVRLRVSVRGSGRPLLLITGLGASLDLAEPFERELVARGLQVIGFDAPGVGRSTPYRRPRRMRGVARTIERMVHELGYEQVDVLGVSLGGAAAQQLAWQAPELVRRLVLAATGVGLGGVPGNPRALLHLATPRRYLDRDYFLRVAGKTYGGGLRDDPTLGLVDPIHRFGAPPTPLGYAGQLFAMAGWTSISYLWRLPHQTLVLAGDDDPIVPVVNGRMLARLVPHARLRVIPGGGHLFLLERAAEVAEIIRDFLKEPARL